MAWWGPILRDVTRRMTKDPRVQKMMREATAKAHEAARAANLHQHFNKAKAAAMNSTAYRTVQDKMRGASAAASKAGSGSGSSGGGAGASSEKLNQTWETIKKRLIPFLLSNMMFVMIIFQFGGAAMHWAQATWAHYRREQEKQRKIMEKERSKMQREAQTTSLLQQQAAEEQERDRARSQKLQELEAQHGGLATMFVTDEEMSDATANRAQLSPEAPAAAEPERLSKKQRRRLQQQQQYGSRRSQGDEDLPLAVGPTAEEQARAQQELQHSNRRVVTSDNFNSLDLIGGFQFRMAEGAVMDGNGQLLNASGHAPFAPGSFAHSANINENDPNFNYAMSSWSGSGGRVTYDPLAWDRVAYWGSGEVHTSPLVDPLRRV